MHNNVDSIGTSTTAEKRDKSSSKTRSDDVKLKRSASRQKDTTENSQVDVNNTAALENLKRKYNEKRQKLKSIQKINEKLIEKLKSAEDENEDLQILNRRLQDEILDFLQSSSFSNETIIERLRFLEDDNEDLKTLNRRLQEEVLDFFQKNKYNLYIASEQPTEDEGIRRDLPETEYEKQSPEKSEEAIPKQESIPEKTDSVASPPLVQETKPSQVEVTEPSQSEEKEVPKANIESIQVNVNESPEVSLSNKKEIESESDNLEEAVVKIQAGIRGYLTRKTLKEQKDNVSPNKNLGTEESHKDDSSKIEISKEEKSSEISEKEMSDDLNEDDADVEKAAVKIQSVYRGYITRKNLSNIGDELTEEENKQTSFSEKESSQDKEEIEDDDDENESGALEQAAVKIQSTFRGYQVRKQRKNGPKKEEGKEQLLIDTDEIQDENEKLESNDPEAEGKAAVKIQAVYRGYKVRKEIKMIGEDGNQRTEFEDINDDKSDTNIDEYSEKTDNDGILKSKATIVLSTPTSNVSKDKTNEEVLISFDTDSDQPMAESPSLLDRNDEEQCFQKPMVPISNETTIPKSVSEPTVDINSVTKSKEDHLISPSSD
ncbi:putative autophagy-related protein 11 isoform X3 [Centruroides vittatus]